MDRRAWLTISRVTLLLVDEYRTAVVLLDNLLRLPLRAGRAREVLDAGAAIGTRLAAARSASPRHGEESIISKFYRVGGGTDVKIESREDQTKITGGDSNALGRTIA